MSCSKPTEIEVVQISIGYGPWQLLHKLLDKLRLTKQEDTEQCHKGCPQAYHLTQ